MLADELLNHPPTAAADSAAATKKSFAAALQAYAAQRHPRSTRIANQAWWSSRVLLAHRYRLGWLRDWLVGLVPMGTDARECALLVLVFDPQGADSMVQAGEAGQQPCWHG